MQLREIARERGVRLPSGINKQGIVERLRQSDALNGRTEAAAPLTPVLERPELRTGPRAPRTRREPHTGYYDERYGTSNPAVSQMLEAGLCADGQGVMELQPDGYGFLRAQNCSPGREDVYVSIAQIRRFGMKNGDLVRGKTRPRREGDRYSALMYVESINGEPPERSAQRVPFDRLTPVHPDRRLTLEPPQGGGDLAIRTLDFIAPIGLGQRAQNCSPGREDVYVSIAQIRRFGMKNGDLVRGKTRPRREGDRYSALMYVESINGEPPERSAQRVPFDRLTPVHPDRRLTLEPPQGGGDLAIRTLDFIAPIGLGQRALIVAPPKAGKTVLLKKIAGAVEAGHPDIHLMMLLIDERPEEVTDIRRSVAGELVYSTFDAPQEHHVRVSEMVYERAQRLVEQGRDVVVLMDSLTRLSRAYNALAPGGRAMSGGLAPGVLQRPKRFFGAARNVEGGGSLTIIATALVETGSRMDDIIYEEFKGTGNAEIHLDRRLSERRIFPAIDLLRSGTRREELLLSPEELEGVAAVRRVLTAARGRDATEQLLGMLEKTRSNQEFFKRLKEWLAIWEKEGYNLGSVRSGI